MPFENISTNSQPVKIAPRHLCVRPSRALTFTHRTALRLDQQCSDPQGSSYPWALRIKTSLQRPINFLSLSPGRWSTAALSSFQARRCAERELRAQFRSECRTRSDLLAPVNDAIQLSNNLVANEVGQVLMKRTTRQRRDGCREPSKTRNDGRQKQDAGNMDGKAMWSARRPQKTLKGKKTLKRRHTESERSADELAGNGKRRAARGDTASMQRS